MKAKAQQTFRCTLVLDADEAETVKAALEILSGEAVKSRTHDSMKIMARQMYEQLADELNEETWRE